MTVYTSHLPFQEILRYTCREVLKAVPFFVSMGDDFTNDIIQHLKPEFYEPNDVVIRQGAQGTKMFFINSGTVEIVTADGERISKLSDSRYFGGTASGKVNRNSIPVCGGRVKLRQCTRIVPIMDDLGDLIMGAAEKQGWVQGSRPSEIIRWALPSVVYV